MIRIRTADLNDKDAIWAILKPIFRAGDTYAITPDISRQDALEFWTGGDHTAFVAIKDGEVLGSYYICPNQKGGGAHVCNCGFATAKEARGQGIARQMLDHALIEAKTQAYRAMQFNFVVASNQSALKIWHENGFEQVGRLPDAFNHPTQGYVDALVFYKTL